MTLRRAPLITMGNRKKTATPKRERQQDNEIYKGTGQAR